MLWLNVLIAALTLFMAWDIATKYYPPMGRIGANVEAKK